MAHYRKIDSRIQNDEKFCSLSDDGQLVFLLILTHPHLTALGAMRGSVAGLAAEKRWPEKRYRKAFQESAAMGMVKYDEKSSLIWLPNFLKYNHPESPNVVRSWASSLELLPECAMKHKLCRMVKAFVKDLPKSFGEALAKDFDKDSDEDLPKDLLKSMPNQEQEQEQKQKQKHLGVEEVFAETSRTPEMSDEADDPDEKEPPDTETVKQQWPPRKTFPDDFPREPPESFLAWAADEVPDLKEAEICLEWHQMLDHEYPDPKTRFYACARRWMRNALKYRSNGARASPRNRNEVDPKTQQWLERQAARKQSGSVEP